MVVDRQHRERGIGRAMADFVDERLRSISATDVVTGVDESDPGSRAWAERRGFSLFDHTFESRLDLERFDASAHRSVVERVEASGLRLEPGTDGQRLYELSLELLGDVPAVDLSPPTHEVFQERVMDTPGAFTLVARDEDVLVGLAIVVPTGEDGAWNWLTGVRREHRGRGIARALKVASAVEAQHRGRRWLGTQNNAVNAPMLAVNDALGYRRDAGMLWLRRTG
jgi:GNAT superfamily N-acetyltransferase